VLTLASLAAAPIENAVSRRYEAEADWAALQATRDPAAATRLFRSFARTSLQQPNPPAWEYVLLQTHPTLAQRIAMAQRWRQATRGGG
jgi:STE24 endopeptidase